METQSDRAENLSETLELMTGLLGLAEQKREHLLKGRVIEALGTEELEESQLARLHQVAGEWQLDSGWAALASRAEAGEKDTLLSAAVRLRSLNRTNRALMISLMRYAHALLGAFGSVTGYGESGHMVLNAGYPVVSRRA